MQKFMLDFMDPLGNCFNVDTYPTAGTYQRRSILGTM